RYSHGPVVRRDLPSFPTRRSSDLKRKYVIIMFKKCENTPTFFRVGDQPMPLERRKQILDLIYKKGVIKTVELAKHFDVNIATIRRDLKILAREHPGIQISYGGASLRKGQTYQREQPMTEKLTQNVEQKMQIAQKAA